MARGKFKGNGNKRDGRLFVAVPYIVIDSPGYRAAGHTARSLLLDIARQYTGHNNGKLVACARYLEPLGWKSNHTVLGALHQLLACGLLVETRKGGFPNMAAWFALSWCDLDQGQDLDIDPKMFRRGGYLQPRQQTPATTRTAKATQARKLAAQAKRQERHRTALAPSHGAASAGVAPSHGGGCSALAPLDGAVPRPVGQSATPLDGAYLEAPSAPASRGGAGGIAALSPSLAAALVRTDLAPEKRTPC
ncbi:MAG: hypothetical protein IH627_05105 [Rubrivivax sp.]|nr:hypothetical protein [Rubrivivax sp.]